MTDVFQIVFDKAGNDTAKPQSLAKKHEPPEKISRCDGQNYSLAPPSTRDLSIPMLTSSMKSKEIDRFMSNIALALSWSEVSSAIEEHIRRLSCDANYKLLEDFNFFSSGLQNKLEEALK